MPNAKRSDTAHVVPAAHANCPTSLEIIIHRLQHGTVPTVNNTTAKEDNITISLLYITPRTQKLPANAINIIIIGVVVPLNGFNILCQTLLDV